MVHLGEIAFYGALTVNDIVLIFIVGMVQDKDYSTLFGKIRIFLFLAAIFQVAMDIPCTIGYAAPRTTYEEALYNNHTVCFLNNSPSAQVYCSLSSPFIILALAFLALNLFSIVSASSKLRAVSRGLTTLNYGYAVFGTAFTLLNVVLQLIPSSGSIGLTIAPLMVLLSSFLCIGTSVWVYCKAGNIPKLRLLSSRIATYYLLHLYAFFGVVAIFYGLSTEYQSDGGPISCNDFPPIVTILAFASVVLTSVVKQYYLWHILKTHTGSKKGGSSNNKTSAAATDGKNTNKSKIKEEDASRDAPAGSSPTYNGSASQTSRRISTDDASSVGNNGIKEIVLLTEHRDAKI